MEIRIIEDKENKLLKRREIQFEFLHEDIGGTPKRRDVKIKLASLLKRDSELLFIKKMETKRGTRVSVGAVNVYNSLEEAKIIEPEYLIKRNLPAEKEEAEATV